MVRHRQISEGLHGQDDCSRNDDSVERFSQRLLGNYPPTPNPPRTDIPIPSPWFPVLTAASAPTPAVIIADEITSNSRFAPCNQLNPILTNMTPLATAYPNGMIVRATRCGSGPYRVCASNGQKFRSE